MAKLNYSGYKTNFKTFIENLLRTVYGDARQWKVDIDSQMTPDPELTPYINIVWTGTPSTGTFIAGANNADWSEIGYEIRLYEYSLEEDGDANKMLDDLISEVENSIRTDRTINSSFSLGKIISTLPLDPPGASTGFFRGAVINFVGGNKA